MKNLPFFESAKEYQPRFVFILLCVIGFIAYGNAINHPFVHDDVVFIQKNPHIHEFNLKSIFQQTISSTGNSTLINTYYRPFLEFLYRLEYQLFGMNPAGYHFVNIVLHISNSFFVFLLLNMLWKGHKVIPLCAAVVFLVHPLQSEAVACVSGISNLVFAFFSLLSFILFLRSAEQSRQNRSESWGYYALSILVFALALLAKEQAVILPVLLIWHEIILGKKDHETYLMKVLKLAGFILVVVFYFLIRKHVLGIVLPDMFGSMPELLLRLKAVPRTLLTYLGIIFFPVDLHYYRSVDILTSFIRPAGFLFFILICLIIIIFRTPQPYRGRILFGAGWFIIAFGPTLNIVPLINEYSFILTAEHFLYLPVIGIIIIILNMACFMLRLINREAIKSLGLYIFTFVTVILIIVTIKQNSYWRGEIPLFKRMLKYEPEFGRGHLLLAKAYNNKGQYADAIVHYYHAEKIFRSYLEKVTGDRVIEFYQGFINEINFETAHCYEALGDISQAKRNYTKVLTDYPESGAAHNNLGTIYLQNGEFDLAIEHFQKAVNIDPKDVRAMNNMAICYIQKKDKLRAEQIFKEILTIDADFNSARENLNLLLKSE